MKKRYHLDFSFVAYGGISVEANSPEDAAEQVKAMGSRMLLSNGCVDGFEDPPTIGDVTAEDEE